MSNSRKIIIIVLIGLTLLLGIGSIYIAIRIQQSQAPAETQAACQTTSNGTTATICNPSGGQYRIHTCNCPNNTGTSYYGNPSCICNENCTQEQIYLQPGEYKTLEPNPSCGAQQIDYDLIGGGGGGVCKGTGNICTTTVNCGASCDATHTCQSGHTCSGGICKLNTCLTPGACSDNSCTPIATVACGASCDATHVCGTGHTCSSGICKLDACLTPGACSDNSCTPITVVQCYQPCTANGPACASGLICMGGDATGGVMVCANEQNPASTTCEPPVLNQPCNATCSVYANPGNGSQANCTAGLYCCSNCDSAGPKCRLASDPFSTTCITTATVTCGSSCDSTHICGTGHTCSGGICKLNACLTAGACSDNACTLATCGDATCNQSELCERTTSGGSTYRACQTSDIGKVPTGALVPSCQMTGTNACRQNPPVCGDGVVNGTEACDPLATPTGCSTGQICSNSCACVTSQCGASCSVNSDCPTDHTCTGGKCVLNGCTANNCTNGCVPLCGGPCNTTTDCPTNHTCTNSKCVLNGCTASTCTNGCIPLPNTAIIDDKTDPILFGVIAVLIGMLIVKFDLVNVGIDYLYSAGIINTKGLKYKAREDNAQKFEKNVSKRMEKK